jgi:hypothetical protein
MRPRAVHVAIVAYAATAAVDPTCAADTLLDQSYVLDGGNVAATSDVAIVHRAVVAGTTSIRGTTEGLHLGASYGITDALTAGVDYSFPLAGDGTDNGKGRGPLRAFAMLLFGHTDRLTLAASTDLDADFCGGYTMGGDCAATTTLHAGVGLKVKLAPVIAIFTGAPFGPGPAGQQLSARLDGPHTVDLDLPVGAALQCTPHLFAFAATNLAHVRLANAAPSEDTLSPIFSDSTHGGLGIPLQLGGYVALTGSLHVGANLDISDAVHTGDLYTILVGARFFEH